MLKSNEWHNLFYCCCFHFMDLWLSLWWAFIFSKFFWSHKKNKITENRLEGTSGSQLAQPPALKLNWVFQDLVHIFSTSKDGDSTVSLGPSWKRVIPTQEISHNRKKKFLSWHFKEEEMWKVDSRTASPIFTHSWNMSNSTDKNLQPHFFYFHTQQEGYGLGSLHKVMSNWVCTFRGQIPLLNDCWNEPEFMS